MPWLEEHRLGLPLAAIPEWEIGLCHARQWVPSDAACQDDGPIHSRQTSAGDQCSPLPHQAVLGFVWLGFFNLLLHGNKAGVREMRKHTLIPSTSLSAQLNQSHKNTLCTSNTCGRLKLSTVCQRKETLEAGQHAWLS